MSEYRCQSCAPAAVPDLANLAGHLGGVQWWRPVDLADVQAEAVAWGIANGRCERHARLIGELVALTIRAEFSRRHLPAIPPLPGR